MNLKVTSQNVKNFSYQKCVLFWQTASLFPFTNNQLKVLFMQTTYEMLETSNTFRVGKCFSKSFPCNPLLPARLARMADALGSTAQYEGVTLHSQGREAGLTALQCFGHCTSGGQRHCPASPHHSTHRIYCLGFCPDQQAASLHTGSIKSLCLRMSWTPRNMRINNTEWKSLTCQILANVGAQ